MTIADFYRSIAPPSTTETGKGEIARRPDTAAIPKGPSEFQSILENSQLGFSKHAETRIRSREINWNEALEKRIQGGIDNLKSKGSREALILTDDLAVIVNVKSRTVVTVMDRSQLKERIFTNIDSTVLV